MEERGESVDSDSEVVVLCSNEDDDDGKDDEGNGDEKTEPVACTKEVGVVTGKAGTEETGSSVSRTVEEVEAVDIVSGSLCPLILEE